MKTAITLLAAIYSMNTHAQVLVSQHEDFSGLNVYSPSLILESSARSYKMWYGGWQSDSDYGTDKIYYRTSDDGMNWSSPVTVIVPSQVLSGAVLANDPSVTKHLNAATHAYQYTMFYTLCVNPCSDYSNNQLWSAVSNDGIHWLYHKPVLQGNEGSSEPSAIIDPQADGTFWKVYYSNTAENHANPNHIFMAAVDGNRNVIRTRTAFTHEGSGVIANPEVRHLNALWRLFFNVYSTDPASGRTTADISVVASPNNRSWSSSESKLITNNLSGAICATVAPGVLVLPSNRMGLYFGQSNFQGNSCRLDTETSMQGWVWQF
jgi:hypothetical protein